MQNANMHAFWWNLIIAKRSRRIWANGRNRDLSVWRCAAVHQFAPGIRSRAKTQLYEGLHSTKSRPVGSPWTLYNPRTMRKLQQWCSGYGLARKTWTHEHVSVVCPMRCSHFRRAVSMKSVELKTIYSIWVNSLLHLFMIQFENI